MGYLTRTQSAGWSEGLPGVARASVVVVAAAAEGTTVAVAAGVAIPLVVGRVGVGPVVVPATLVVGATIQPVVEPIVLA